MWANGKWEGIKNDEKTETRGRTMMILDDIKHEWYMNNADCSEAKTILNVFDLFIFCQFVMRIKTKTLFNNISNSNPLNRATVLFTARDL